MKKNGFTLIELVVVIVILGILAVTAAPRFLNVSTDSHIAVVKGTGASFKTGVDFAYSKNLTSNGGGASTNVPIYDESATGQLDFNEWGYPAQQWYAEEDFPRLDNTEDCISVWALYFLIPLVFLALIRLQIQTTSLNIYRRISVSIIIESYREFPLTTTQ
ncbi:type II secretion system protein [Vibrio splendidus]|uniref:type II secretion system protein n=1 Tax=Vibrio splendidus TaxID=29497 RepID=UPI002410549A|nr:type II secretion system protein [Vibrio splendidus]